VVMVVEGIVGPEEEDSADIKLSLLEPDLNNYTDILITYGLFDVAFVNGLTKTSIFAETVQRTSLCRKTVF
jgi:hypothetical protein